MIAAEPPYKEEYNVSNEVSFLKKIITLATCVMLGACAEYQTAKPVDVVFNAKQQQGLRGYHPTAIRAFNGTATQKTEIVGAPCEVTGSGFSAKIVTPAAVNIPVYGLRSKALYVKCSFNGQELDKSVPPLNLTEQKALANGASGGLLGVIVVGAVVAGRKNKEQDEYGYNVPNFVFKKTE